jgi:hypothetical protein
VELHHINWFSRRGHETGVERGVFGDDGQPVNPEPGENRTTRDAFSLCLRESMSIVQFGPFEIDRELYRRALRQIDFLEGRVPGRRPSYKCFDLGFREGAHVAAVNCIHAISDVDRDDGPFRTFTLYGEAAAREVVNHLARWIKRPALEQSGVWAQIWAAIWLPDAPPSLELLDGTSTISFRVWSRGPAAPSVREVWHSGSDATGLRRAALGRDAVRTTDRGGSK